MSERKKLIDITDPGGDISYHNCKEFARNLVNELRRKAINRKRRDQNGRALGFRAAANIIAEAFELD